jgi:hypothetical protein
MSLEVVTGTTKPAHHHTHHEGANMREDPRSHLRTAEVCAENAKSKFSIPRLTTLGFLTLALTAASTAACASEDPFNPLAEDVSVERKAEALTFAQHQAICQSDPRVVAGLVSLEVCVGAGLFFRETFDGNGRTCASCHRAERNFTVDPEFIATLPSNDPLFVAEFNPALANLERPPQMRASSLILENVDGTQPGGPNVRFALRSVPHNLSMGVSIKTPAGQPSPPLERTGWSGDGAPFQGRLADFTNGAIGQHMTKRLDRVAGTDFRVATEAEGQAVARFMIELGRKNEIDLASIGFADARSDTGRQRFLAVGCNGCHRNGGANTGANVENRNFNTGVELARHPALASFPRDGGFGLTPTNPDGSFGDQTFNSTPVIEAADTGPFFHTDTTVSGAPSHNTDVAETIEEAVAFYGGDAFAAARGARLAITATDIVDIGRFLRGLNAVFNIQIAIKRVLGARELGNRFGIAQRLLQNRVLVLARVEISDALQVLQEAEGGTLNGQSQAWLTEANNLLNTAINSTSHGTRMQAMGDAFNRLDLADTNIAANINFNMGSGNLMD